MPMTRKHFPIEPEAEKTIVNEAVKTFMSCGSISDSIRNTADELGYCLTEKQFSSLLVKTQTHLIEWKKESENTIARIKLFPSWGEHS